MIIEQIALKTDDIQKRIREINTVLSVHCWIQDHVQAEHIYLHPLYLRGELGSLFEVHLAFNYDLIPSKELELISLIVGESVQWHGSHTEGLAHFGYHIPDGARLLADIEKWNALGYPCVQVSHTIHHTGTDKRYLYAFIDTRSQVGTYTKIISRVSEPKSCSDLVKEFSHVNPI